MREIPPGYVEIRPGVYERLHPAKLAARQARAVLRDEATSHSRSIERAIRNESVATPKRKAAHTKSVRERVKILVTHRRSRLADPDGLVAKWIIDCIVMSGVVTDDSAKYVSVEQVQESVKSKTEEETLIELFHE
jgi:hypothetical protein